MNTEAFAHQTLVISTASLALTLPDGRVPDRALVSVTNADIRFWLDGTAPTSSLGHPAAAGTTLALEGPGSVAGFRAIRSSGSDATLVITYERRIG